MYSLNGNVLNECEQAEEAVASDTDEYLSDSLRCDDIDYSSYNTRTITIEPNMSSSMDNCSILNSNIDVNNIPIPIVGYEIMEERARFTVYKLRIENKINGNCWYVFRRYTDFVRLCNGLRSRFPEIIQHLPRKRWLKNNFDPVFLEERISGLQTLINAITNSPNIFALQEIQDFFCLNEPPVYSETNGESRAILEAMEETISNLKQQLQEKESLIDSLQINLHSQVIENENLKKLVRTSTTVCHRCQKACENFNPLIK